MKIKKALLPLLLAGSLAGLSGCSAKLANVENVACRPLSGTVRAPSFPGTVFTIVMENRNAAEIIRPGGPPFLNELARTYAYAANYFTPPLHPSEPNYIWMTSGQNFGILDNDAPALNHIAATSHLANQIEAAGLSWKSYQESMGEPCGLELVGSLYDPKHNPFVYYDDINGWNGSTFTRPKRCTERVVDYSQLDADLKSGNVPRYVFITPNLTNDMHDGTILNGDAWLGREVPKILTSPAYTRGGVLFLTWDEGSLETDHIVMIAISPYAKKGYTSNVRYDHSSFLRTVQRILGVDELPCAAEPDQVAAMTDLFAVPIDQPAPPPAQLR
ncbi:MAG: alkaline phosphatase family protein [Polyangia bacterium]